MSLIAVALTIFGFLLGSVMFSYWIGRLTLRRDIREIGDGNPGGFNLIKTGNIPAAGLGIFLDIGKGVLPAGLAVVVFHIVGIELIPIALAPVFGHAYSPFMRFKGGKAVAVTGGVWLALQPLTLLLFTMPLFVLSFAAIAISGWAVAVTVGVMLIYHIVIDRDPVLITIWVITGALLLWKYRADLRKPFTLRPWLARRIGRADRA